MASNGPLPAQLTLLSSLPSYASGSKVRFLGCVNSYNSQKGILELTHAYPSSIDGPIIRAIVDVNVILETMRRDDLEAGAWVNVLGYVQGRKKNAGDGAVSVNVQAIMIWGAGSVELGKYETAVSERLSAVEKK